MVYTQYLISYSQIFFAMKKAIKSPINKDEIFKKVFPQNTPGGIAVGSQKPKKPRQE